MKNLLFVAILSIFAHSVFAKDIQQLVFTTTPPMHCENCENKIKKGEVRFVKGVKNIETNLQEQRVTVTYDADKTTPAKIEEAFGKIGYKVEVINPEPDANTGATKQSGQTSREGCSGSCCSGKK